MRRAELLSPRPYATFRIPHSEFRIGNAGFNLIELLVVVLLLFVLGGAFLTAFLTGQTSYLSADAYVRVQEESRKAFDNMVRELREAGNVSCGTGAVTTACTSSGSAARLNFQIAKNYSGGIVWGNDTVDGGWVHYVLNGSQLVRYQSGAAGDSPPATCTTATNCRVLANDVDTGNVSFEWAPAPTNTVTVRLRVRYANPRLPGGYQAIGGTDQAIQPLTSRVRLRNPNP